MKKKKFQLTPSFNTVKNGVEDDRVHFQKQQKS